MNTTTRHARSNLTRWTREAAETLARSDAWTGETRHVDDVAECGRGPAARRITGRVLAHLFTFGRVVSAMPDGRTAVAALALTPDEQRDVLDAYESAYESATERLDRIADDTRTVLAG